MDFDKDRRLGNPKKEAEGGKGEGSSEKIISLTKERGKKSSKAKSGDTRSRPRSRGPEKRLRQTHQMMAEDGVQRRRTDDDRSRDLVRRVMGEPFLITNYSQEKRKTVGGRLHQHQGGHVLETVDLQRRVLHAGSAHEKGRLLLQPVAGTSARGVSYETWEKKKPYT